MYLTTWLEAVNKDELSKIALHEHLNDFHSNAVSTLNTHAIAERAARRYYDDSLTNYTVDETFLQHCTSVIPDLSYWSWPAYMPGCISMNDNFTVNVYVTERDYIERRPVAMKLGKYLRKLGYADWECNQWTNQIKSDIRLAQSAELKLATGADIVDIYVNGPNSCMSGDSFYEGEVHPAAVYDSPDLACAYVQYEGETKIRARAMVNLIEDTYSVIYGNFVLLEKLLKANGYTEGDLEGCRIRAIPHDTTWVMPYIDGTDYVSETHDPEYLRIDSCGDIYCCNTYGIAADNYVCDCCGFTTNDPDEFYILGEWDVMYACDQSCAESLGWVYTEEWGNMTLMEDAYYSESDGRWYESSAELVYIDGYGYYALDDCDYNEDLDEWKLA